MDSCKSIYDELQYYFVSQFILSLYFYTFHLFCPTKQLFSKLSLLDLQAICPSGRLFSSCLYFLHLHNYGISIIYLLRVNKMYMQVMPFINF